jgi:splicing suppressor protein 51
MANIPPTCAACQKTAQIANARGLITCPKCKTTLYCSWDCWKADSKMHREACVVRPIERPPRSENSTYRPPAFAISYAAPRKNTSAVQPCSAEEHISNPFTKLVQGTYLHDRPEKDVYQLLIDSFRWREYDDKGYGAKMTPTISLLGSRSSTPFHLYLFKAST